MKALTDKIVNELTDEKNANKRSVQYCDGITYAISTTLELTDDAAFEEVARMMMRYLCENHHPHVTVIITPTTAELVEGIKTIGQVLDYVQD